MHCEDALLLYFIMAALSHSIHTKPPTPSLLSLPLPLPHSQAKRTNTPTLTLAHTHAEMHIQDNKQGQC